MSAADDARQAAAPDRPGGGRAQRQRGAGEGSLTADDWIACAAEVLETEPVRSLRIATLCARLGVTKGSFYWHFGSRQDLLAALLGDWRRRMTLDVISRLSQASPTIDTLLRNTLALIRKKRPGRQTATERGIREWARSEPEARAALLEVDETRLAFFEGQFAKAGFDAGEARLRGYAAYALMMGDSVLKDTIGDRVHTDRYLDRVIDMLLKEDSPQAG
ncbi:TetR/AcrR family transcriptional regulator [Marinibaculum pumilum]|uniref:TetR/AcrR family transcriptional regulator n=1 Tax=Marinibaculum pumilum TaxID=1766165 RepID=A0ABV7L124_9PROT